MVIPWPYFRGLYSPGSRNPEKQVSAEAEIVQRLPRSQCRYGLGPEVHVGWYLPGAGTQALPVDRSTVLLWHDGLRRHALTSLDLKPPVRAVRLQRARRVIRRSVLLLQLAPNVSNFFYLVLKVRVAVGLSTRSRPGLLEGVLSRDPIQRQA